MTTPTRVWCGLGAALVLVLYVVVAAGSYGYDDEFFNIDFVEKARSYGDLVATVNSTDVHPPGSYLLNKVALDVLGSWRAVRIASGVLTALALLSLWCATLPTRPLPRVYSYVCVCLSPALLLWGTSLRWYAYFVPLLIALMLLTFRGLRNSYAHWALVFVLSSAMFYLEYVAVLVVPPLVLMSAWRRKAWSTERWAFLGAGALGVALCLPQLPALFNVHLDNAHTQTSGILASVMGAGSHLLSGYGALPLSAIGISLILANVLIVVLAVPQLRALLREDNTRYLVVTLPLMVIAGLSAKSRNLVTLSPAQGVFQSRVLEESRYRALTWLAFALLVVGTGGGIYNITNHSRTVKGSWNTPYEQVMETVKEQQRGCSESVFVGFELPTLHYAKDVVDDVVDVHDQGWRQEIDPGWDCLIVADTFRGALEPERHEDLRAFIKERPGRPQPVVRLGADPDADFKRRFDSTVPDYYVTLYSFRR